MMSNLIDELLDWLVTIPALRDQDNRNIILRSIPDGLIGTIPRGNASLTDLTNIITYAESWGKLTTVEAFPLEIILENIRRFVAKTQREQELEDLKRKYLASITHQLPIQIAVIAMTQIQAQKLYTEQVFENEIQQLNFVNLKSTLERDGFESLLNCYDQDNPDKWKPLITDHQISVETMITQSINLLSQKSKGTFTIFPHYLSNHLLSDDKTQRQHAETQLCNYGGVVIVDPISLYHPVIRKMINLETLTESKKVALLIISPLNHLAFELNQLLEKHIYNTVLQQAFENLFQDYQQPICEFGINNQAHLQRWLVTIFEQFRGKPTLPISEGRAIVAQAVGRKQGGIATKLYGGGL